MSDLPQGWSEPRLGEVADIAGGQTPKGLATTPVGPVPFFKVGDMNTTEGARMTTSRTYLDSSAVQSLRLRLWPVGTVVFPKQGGAIATNKKRVLAVEGACDLNTMGVIPSNGLLSIFLLHWFETLDLAALSDGTVVAQIKPSKVGELRFPLPPLNEQRRIVAAIEEQLSRLDAADASLAAASLRLVVLQAASRAASIDPEWPTLPFGDVTVNFDGRRVPVKSDDRAKRPGLYPYYGASGVIDTIDDFIFDGDYLLVAEDGANLVTRSKPIAFRASGRFWVNNHAHVVQTTDQLDQRFLESFLNGPILSGLITGTAQPKLTQANLNKIPVPVPPLEEQRRIVARVEEQLAAVDALRAAIERAELERAFRGELVPQDPSDEPASTLLTRIRAERDAAGSPGKRRTATR